MAQPEADCSFPFGSCVGCFSRSFQRSSSCRHFLKCPLPLPSLFPPSTGQLPGTSDRVFCPCSGLPASDVPPLLTPHPLHPSTLLQNSSKPIASLTPELRPLPLGTRTPCPAPGPSHRVPLCFKPAPHLPQTLKIQSPCRPGAGAISCVKAAAPSVQLRRPGRLPGRNTGASTPCSSWRMECRAPSALCMSHF